MTLSPAFTSSDTFSHAEPHMRIHYFPVDHHFTFLTETSQTTEGFQGTFVKQLFAWNYVFELFKQYQSPVYHQIVGHSGHLPLRPSMVIENNQLLDQQMNRR